MDSTAAGESALERARSAGPVPEAASGPGRRAGGLLAPLKIGLVMALLGGAVAYLLLGGNGESPFVYSKRVDEVAVDPAQFVDRTLRVEGQLRTGSIQFRQDPCEWRFVLEQAGQSMPVEYSQCVVPDTFRDGMGISVVVEGRIRGDGSFVASQVIPRCPSRYEMDQRRQSGQTMPHAAPATGQPSAAGPPSSVRPSVGAPPAAAVPVIPSMPMAPAPRGD